MTVLEIEMRWHRVRMRRHGHVAVHLLIVLVRVRLLMWMPMMINTGVQVRQVGMASICRWKVTSRVASP